MGGPRGQRWAHEEEVAGSDSDVSTELGDVLFLLARLALVSGVDLEGAASSVLEKIRLRLTRSG